MSWDRTEPGPSLSRWYSFAVWGEIQIQFLLMGENMTKGGKVSYKPLFTVLIGVKRKTARFCIRAVSVQLKRRRYLRHSEM
jgi:hypothetical protein